MTLPSFTAEASLPRTTAHFAIPARTASPPAVYPASRQLDCVSRCEAGGAYGCAEYCACRAEGGGMRCGRFCASPAELGSIAAVVTPLSGTAVPDRRSVPHL